MRRADSEHERAFRRDGGRSGKKGREKESKRDAEFLAAVKHQKKFLGV